MIMSSLTNLLQANAKDGEIIEVISSQVLTYVLLLGLAIVNIETVYFKFANNYCKYCSVVNKAYHMLCIVF